MDKNYEIQNLKIAILELNKSNSYWQNKYTDRAGEIEKLQEIVNDLKAELGTYPRFKN